MLIHGKILTIPGKAGVVPTPTDQTIIYHDATKHDPRRFARSLGYLDWDTQPSPFRRFNDAALIHLPIPPDDPTPEFDALCAGATTPAAIDLNFISRLFYLSLAISAWKQAGRSRWALRCNPSSGNLHPTEGYAVLPAIHGLHDQPAVYHYAAREHALERRAALASDAWPRLMADLPQHAFLIGLSSVYWREAWKYGERAFRYCHQDVGHALCAMRFAAAALGWRMVMLDELSDEEVSAALGLDRTDDFKDAEPEHPDCLAVVTPNNAPTPAPRTLVTLEPLIHAQWTGRANRLSSAHVEWDIIDMAAEATIKPHTQTAHVERPWPPKAHAHMQQRSGKSAQSIIRQRRSALAFDGTTSIDDSVLYGMLMRLMPETGGPPWDLWPWPPRIHLLLFVHHVRGLPPGLYALARDTAKVCLLKPSLKADFDWSRPSGCPEQLPFFHLQTADCRRAATHVSLQQDIAGMGVLSLGMIGELEDALREHGPWFYRRLFWEAGMIGQVLYLEAEAAGIRATGIGAYFDDLVHDVFGISEHGLQSMYHFSMGGQIDDPRLTTLPSYPAPAPD